MDTASNTSPMRVAYADPPYPGQAKRHYGKNGDPYQGEVAEVDHADLISTLERDFSDGWALSTDARSIRDIWNLCPDARVGIWVKPFAATKNIRITYAWEPVLFKVRGGRMERQSVGFLRDWVAAMPPVFVHQGKGVAGQKPLEFCYWLFDILGVGPEDEFVDMFPGSGAVTEAWESWCRQRPIWESVV